MLAERTGLAHLVTYRQGDALDLPFPDGAFDVVWTQHAAMNIPDKATLYRGMRDELRYYFGDELVGVLDRLEERG